MRISFSFRWVPFVATLLLVALGVSLGNWQLRRADEKRAIEARMAERRTAAPVVLGAAQEDIDAIEYRRVLVRGEFERDWPLYLDNRPQAGVAGFYLLMPFKIAGTNKHVLVARGWLPVDVRRRSNLPPLVTPTGIVEIIGLARRNPGHVLQLGQASAVRQGAILQNLTVAEIATASGFDMQPLLIEQANDMQGKQGVQDGLVRDWPLPSVGIERHLGYAFQWYALALTAFLFFVVTGYRRGNK